MVLRLISATEARTGTTILIDDEAYTVRSMDTSKTGKHGASKCRIEAIAVFSNKKKIVAVPGDTRFEVPNIDKHKAQVLSIEENIASVMDLETYETLELPFLEELKDKLEPEKKVEYWNVEGKKMIMRTQ